MTYWTREILSQTIVILPEDLSKVEDEWPRLPQPESALLDPIDKLQLHCLDRQNGSDRIPSDGKEITRDTLTPKDTSGTGSKRTKKQRLEKSSENLYDGIRLFYPRRTKTDLPYDFIRSPFYPTDTLTIATLNINRLESATRVHDLDILLLQKVTQPITLGLSSY
jgi:hypothetical protein